MKVVLTGLGGQLGQELKRTVPESVELIAYDKGRLDITDEKKVNELVQAASPDWIINAAAYTNVDGAESNLQKAYTVNRDGAGYVASAAQSSNAKMLHISTDYVFDGRKGGLYRTDDHPSPLSVYGRSKCEGEDIVLSILGARAIVLRSAWVYSGSGNNFVKTMLRLMSEKEELAVVCDQIGSPTWGRNLAKAAWGMVLKDAGGVHHWTDAGVASWYDFAILIRDEAVRIGLLSKRVSIRPILSEEYPCPAKRPECCVLDKSHTSSILGYDPEHWGIALRNMLAEMQ